jgi:leucyl-tRNA synthetase
MTAHAAQKGFGREAVTYRLKDWLISRQRYWGTPIPVVYCERDGVVGLRDEDLPVVLPKDAPFTGEGGNPLEKVPEFVKAACRKCGGPARRETDTMDTFVDSSWYFYRYLSPRKDDGPFDAAAVRRWFPIDLYVGGIEHAILHLVYSRFWTKVMRDLGLVALDEPVVRLFPQGMVHKDGEVMSKSKSNTVAPDDVIREWGADTLRLYILSVAPPELHMEWSTENISGSHRLIQRIWRLVHRHLEGLRAARGAPIAGDLPPAAREMRRKVHQTILKVTEDVEERIHLNTAVAALHELVNEIYRVEEDLAAGPGRAALLEAVETVLRLLNPFTPHACEEMWAHLGHETELVDEPWPEADREAAREEAVELAVQVNGKVRGRITVPAEAGEEEVRRRALEEPKVREHVSGREIVKLVVVPNRLVSVVVR